jgi:hypothetical protein
LDRLRYSVRAVVLDGFVDDEVDGAFEPLVDIGDGGRVGDPAGGQADDAEGEEEQEQDGISFGTSGRSGRRILATFATTAAVATTANRAMDDQRQYKLNKRMTKRMPKGRAYGSKDIP